MITDPDDTTLASYQAAADSYIEQSTPQPGPFLRAPTSGCRSSPGRIRQWA
jgi:hypothetical protein